MQKDWGLCQQTLIWIWALFFYIGLKKMANKIVLLALYQLCNRGQVQNFHEPWFSHLWNGNRVVRRLSLSLGLSLLCPADRLCPLADRPGYPGWLPSIPAGWCGLHYLLDSHAMEATGGSRPSKWRWVYIVATTSLLCDRTPLLDRCLFREGGLD